MIRTIISLEPEDKQWLEQKAKASKTTMTALVRQAVKQMRTREEASSPSFESLLEKTQGIWQEEGLAYQHRIRGDWS